MSKRKTISVKPLPPYSGPCTAHLVDPGRTRDNDDTGPAVTSSLVVDNQTYGDCVEVEFDITAADFFVGDCVRVQLDRKNARRLITMLTRDVAKLAAIQKVEKD